MVECPRCHARYEQAPAFCGECGTKVPGRDPLVAPAADPLIGIVIDGRYRILDLLGRGGMGAVYRVEHVKMGKVMAMKILPGALSENTDLVRRFKREAEAVSRLSHMNTVSVFDFGSHQGMMYLVMEYIEGRNLGDLIRAEGPLPFRRAAGILIQTCSALNEAHGKNIVHRDLKPENIIVGARDEQADFVKVLDFGLAQLRDAQEKTRLTQHGCLVGTPYYMAPEHIRAEAVDGRTDVYALGAVLYKILTGETPFTADTPMGVITKHLTEEPPPPSERFPALCIPKAVDGIVLKAMAKRPEERYASADEMRRALADALTQVDPSSPYHRFSSVNTAETPAPQSTPSTAPMPAIPAAPAGGEGGRRISALSKSVIIGAREVEIGTKSDFIEFKRTRQVKRVVLVAVLGALVVVAAAAGVYLALARSVAPSAAELEPNDAPETATAARVGDALAGGLGPKDAADWYAVAVGAPVRTVQVTGVPGMDLELLLRLGSRAEEYVVNNAGVGVGEGVTLPAGPGPTFVRVRQLPVAGQAPAAGAYQILFQ